MRPFLLLLSLALAPLPLGNALAQPPQPQETPVPEDTSAAPSSSDALPSAADKAAAEALFKQARALSDEGRHAAACPKFAASQQLDPGLGTLLHLADCYERTGKLASAWATFEQAASVASARGEAERADIAKVRAAALFPQLIQLVINVPEARPDGFEVKRNGLTIPEASFATPLPVDSGTWLIRASAPGHEPFEVSLQLEQGQSEPYSLTIPDLVPTAVAEPIPAPLPPPQEPAKHQSEPPPPIPTVDDDAADQKTLGLIIGSAGLLAGVVSGIFTIMAVSSNSDSKDFCDARDLNECSSEGVAERDEALNQAAVATGAGIVSAVGIVAGATLYFTAPTESASPGAMIQIGGTW